MHDHVRWDYDGAAQPFSRECRNLCLAVCMYFSWPSALCQVGRPALAALGRPWAWRAWRVWWAWWCVHEHGGGGSRGDF